MRPRGEVLALNALLIILAIPDGVCMKGNRGVVEGSQQFRVGTSPVDQLRTHDSRLLNLKRHQGNQTVVIKLGT